jgi:hypothetical protein
MDRYGTSLAFMEVLMRMGMDVLVGVVMVVWMRMVRIRPVQLAARDTQTGQGCRIMLLLHPIDTDLPHDAAPAILAHD